MLLGFKGLNRYNWDWLNEVVTEFRIVCGVIFLTIVTYVEGYIYLIGFENILVLNVYCVPRLTYLPFICVFADISWWSVFMIIAVTCKSRPHITSQLNFVNTLRPRQDGRHFRDDIFKCIFFNENARISLKKSLKFVPTVRINNIPALFQIMVWRRSCDKPLSEPIVVDFLTHMCVTRPQWVLINWNKIISPLSFPWPFLSIHS